MNDPKEPFLSIRQRAANDDEDDEGGKYTAEALDKRKNEKRQRRRRTAIAVFVHASLIALYTLVSIAVIRTATKLSAVPAAIERLTVRHEPKLFRNLSDNPFAGAPRPEVDRAWEDLLFKMNIRVTDAELVSHGQESVALPDGGGHLAWLGVFHDLHCMNMVRKWAFRDYYHPNLTAEETKHMLSHADHCFEMLRQGIMCQADTSSLATFKWDRSRRKPMFDVSRSRHTCVDWEAMLASIDDRVVDEEELGALVNPLMPGS